uniref:Dynein light chain n=1 Tax=Cyprinus carpio TaxID=7962 RepID=A0A8C2Q7I1_CYPCA
MYSNRKQITMVKTPIHIKKAVMSAGMQRDALQCALLAVNMYKKGTNIATYIKKEFDRKHQASWQCIVGSTGYLVTHNNCYIDFKVGNRNILLFKAP